MHRLVPALVALALPALALAEERASTKQAEALVHNAVAFLKKQGKEKAFASFSDPSGPFTYRDLYIVAYDLAGKCLAHGQKKDRVGKSLLDDKDASGKAFIRERVKLAKEQAGFWQEYQFMNPVTKTIEHKVAYCEVAEAVIVCGGAYRP